MPAVNDLNVALSNAKATQEAMAKKLREDFLFAAQMGRELRAEGFTSARVRWAKNGALEYRRGK